jgi:hypothetical protein
MAKCKVISESETFKPVTLQITLESQAEVEALFCVVDAQSEAVYNTATKGEIYKSSCWEDWDAVAVAVFSKLEEIG